ncbi:MAG: tripartite tricarboxylate transporter permease [Deltaproteobacteria bacterium]|nr:tripartite tricarboxylate transporter permease [Deltaproteobacteria bacterium]MBW2044418.1 tripartite tricarboxylate transporter permease [Deltaproteobacteria bacterium]
MSILVNGYHFYIAGWHLFMSPLMIGFLFLGTIIGIVFGVIPGLTSTMGLAVFIPLTFGMDPYVGIVLLMGIYVGSIYAGSITAILVNIPGTPGAIVTGLEGYPMTLKRESGRAIGISATASLLGGFIGIIFLSLLAPAISKVALRFNSVDYVALAFLGLSVVSYISSGSILKGLIAVVIGLMLASVGTDPMTGAPRFTFGSNEVYSGLPLIPVLIAFFGLPEVLENINLNVPVTKMKEFTKIIPTHSDLKQISGAVIRGGILGTFIGAVPFAGGAISCMMNYAIEKMISKEPESFGKGNIRGLAAPEASNNASVGGALIPLLTLGIPGDPMTAVILGAFLVHGISPGPLLFEKNPEFISSIFIGNTLATLLIFIIGISCAKYFAKLISIPQRILAPIIMIFCIVGSYAIRNSIFDIGIFAFFGIGAYLLRKVGIMPAPLVLGFILGPIFEENLRRVLMISGMDWSLFIKRPSSVIMLAVGCLILFSPLIFKMMKPKSK